MRFSHEYMEDQQPEQLSPLTVLIREVVRPVVRLAQLMGHHHEYSTYLAEQIARVARNAREELVALADPDWEDQGAPIERARALLTAVSTTALLAADGGLFSQGGRVARSLYPSAVAASQDLSSLCAALEVAS